MSGAEAVAGLVLGVLPLLVSAAEHYEDIFQAFTRYRNYGQELQKFQRQLEAQKTIFRNECQHLLTSITDWEEADQMLRMPGHPFRADLAMDRKFAQQLGSSGNACEALIALIEKTLKDVDQENEDFASVISNFQKPDSSTKEWRRCLLKRLKFSFSKSGLDKCMTHLRDLNRDFVTLSSQIVRIKDANKPKNPTGSGHIRWSDAKREIKGFQAIQRASGEVYNALGKACTVHTTHSAQLCLEAKHVSSKQTQIRFDMAFNHLALGTSAISGDPIWLGIEYISSGSLAGDPPVIHNGRRRPLEGTLSNLTNTLKHQQEVPPLLGTKKQKAIRSTSTALGLPRDSVVCEQLSSSDSEMIPKPPLPYLDTRSNFCVQVRKRWDELHEDRDVCIGLLERTSNCQHVVYLAPPTTPDYVKKAMTLAHIISLTSETNELGSLPQYSKLRLARLLSVGILQFRETPWLSEGWRSQQVVFFNTGDDETLHKSPLPSPYLNVPVIRTENVQCARSPASPTQGCLAPNALLYSLGIVLLEVAYEAPLRSLQKPCDLQVFGESRYTEFFTARRLSKTLGSALGATYGQIVRKCLNCDFGCGDDLSDPALQLEFYRDVVCELQRLEECFNKLQLGP